MGKANVVYTRRYACVSTLTTMAFSLYHILFPTQLDGILQA